jgi:hypothetical protein
LKKLKFLFYITITLAGEEKRMYKYNTILTSSRRTNISYDNFRL